MRNIDGGCRGIVTADVLLEGLSHGAIATRKLKGVNRDKGHARFILVQPLAVKEGLRLVGLVLLEVSMTRERDTLCAVLNWLFSCPKPPAGRPLIYTGRRPAAYRVPA